MVLFLLSLSGSLAGCCDHGLVMFARQVRCLFFPMVVILPRVPFCQGCRLGADVSCSGSDDFLIDVLPFPYVNAGPLLKFWEGDRGLLLFHIGY